MGANLELTWRRPTTQRMLELIWPHWSVRTRTSSHRGAGRRQEGIITTLHGVPHHVHVLLHILAHDIHLHVLIDSVAAL